MSTHWGVYPVRRKGESKKWLVRWRVNGTPHKRTFSQKGHAETFHRLLVAARVNGMPADSRGWPPPATGAPSTPVTAPTPEVPRGRTFEDYATTVWYPTHKDRWSDKNRLGHRNNMRFAINTLRYAAGDPRLNEHPELVPGQSLLLRHIVPDDVIGAINLRRRTNGRTAAKNERLVAAAFESGVGEVDVVEEVASVATVRAFYITLSMILKAAKDNNHIPHDPLRGVSAHAPAPRGISVVRRIVPSLEEVFDLADAIAALGPIGPDGLPAGERFRSLVLAAGTLGARPGELAAHHPDWFDWSTPPTIILRRSYTPVYDAEEGITARSDDGLNSLKHRQADEVRVIPMITDVAAAITTHLARGYAPNSRTWTSVEGRTLDWGNLMTTYWRPACEAVFGGSSKSHLVAMTPNMLRKAAVTFWLDSGVHPAIASEWAGHSEDVAKRHYAGRTSHTYEKELALLAARQNPLDT